MLTRSALFLLLGSAAAAQTIANGDFEQSPPGLPGWRELGLVVAGPAGSQGTANSALLGPSAGQTLQGGAWVGSAIWQTFDTGTLPWPVAIEFDYRALPSTCVWVEVDGPAGPQGAWLPTSSLSLFASYWVQYPQSGRLTISFNTIEQPAAGGGIQGLFQVDHVSSEVGDVPAGTQLPLLASWLPTNPTTSKELAIVELYGIRSATGLSFTSPKGYETIEGDGMHGHVLFSKPWVVWQQVDSTLRGQAQANLRALSFRRDLPTASNSAFVARTVTLAVVLAHGDVQKITTTHASNYKDQPVTVFTPKPVNTPDWSQQPAGANPAPFDLRIPFDTRFSYNGQDDLLWEVQITANSLPAGAPFVNYPCDVQSVPGSFSPASAAATQSGVGCRTVGQTGTFSLQSTFYNHKTKFRWTAIVANGPPSTAITMNASGTDPNLGLPILCTALRANADLLLPLGVTDTKGAITTATIDNIPYASALVGQTLYGQAIGLDPTQPQLPYSLSNGIKVVVPGDPQFPPLGRVYSWQDTVGGATSSSGPFASGVVVLID